MAILESIERYSHLGTEFLTWLWCKSEKGNGKIRLEGLEPVEVRIAGPLVLESALGDAVQVQLKGDDPAAAPEAQAALLENKQLRKCKLYLQLDGVDWEATLDAKTFSLTGVRIPAPSSGIPYDDAVALRMEQMDRFSEVFLSLFNAFLEIRLEEKTWNRETKKIREWLGEK